jgi:hypothetical protein
MFSTDCKSISVIVVVCNNASIDGPIVFRVFIILLDNFESIKHAVCSRVTFITVYGYSLA